MLLSLASGNQELTLCPGGHDIRYCMIEENLMFTVLIVVLSGPDNLDNLRKIAEQFQKQGPGATVEDDDNDVPELVAGETFEEAANEGQTS